jgi:hypothetical protein
MLTIAADLEAVEVMKTSGEAEVGSRFGFRTRTYKSRRGQAKLG